MSNLVKYDAACRAIAIAKSVDEVSRIRNKMEAMRAYAKQAKNRGLEIDAAELRLRAERRLGEMIKTQKATVGLQAGARGRAGPGRGRKNGVTKGNSVFPPTLADVGIDKKLSSKAQQLAAIPKERFERELKERRVQAESGNDRITLDLLKRVQLSKERETYQKTIEGGCKVEDLAELTAKGKKFSVIYADPPWKFHVYSGAEKQRTADRRYDSSSLETIKQLPVEALAAEDCALFLWTVMPEIPGALEVMSAWGFDYTTVGFTWVKQNRGGSGLFMGMGNWTRANAEICLLGTRGHPKRRAMDVAQVVTSPVREHSQKPDEVRARIERLVDGPYLELYGRQPVQGWTVWGNEIPQLQFLEAVIPEFIADRHLSFDAAAPADFPRAGLPSNVAAAPLWFPASPYAHRRVSIWMHRVQESLRHIQHQPGDVRG